MAIVNIGRTRPALVALALGTALVVVPGVAAATPHGSSAAKPTVAQLQKKLGELALQNTQLVEKYNQARLATSKAKAAATKAQDKADAASRSYEIARQQYVSVVQNQYESNGLGAAGALLESDSDSDYLDRINSLGMMSSHVTQVIGRIDRDHKSAQAAADAAHTLYATAKDRSDALTRQRADITKRIDSYQSMLSQLNAQQRATFLRAQNPSVPFKTLNLPSATSGAAEKAVQFALAQLGKPYVFGAAGPDSYDCSGLTMDAWQAGGVSLPHSAAGQYDYGTHVSLDNLTPGDLIFMYQPIGHVTIYIGDGYMVSAPTEGQDVTVVPVSAFSGEIVGATHIG